MGNGKKGTPMGMGGLRVPPGPPPPEAAAKLEQLMELATQAQAAKRAQHTPVLKTLETLGIALKTETVAGRTVVMIPLDELMEKEYAYMTGIDVAGVREQAVAGRIDLADNRNRSEDDGTEAAD